MALRIVIFGPPGSGKGTYATLLKTRLGTPHISTGDLVREEIRNKTTLGKEIEKYSSEGKLVPDEVITEILKKRLTRDLSTGFILEGYPRTINQAEQLEKMTKIDAVINLDVPDRVIVERLSARVQCESCATIYNERTLKPRVAGRCDKCGGRLVRRADDQSNIILDRLRIYKEASAPIIGYYRTRKILKDVSNTDPEIPPEIVADRIMKLL